MAKAESETSILQPGRDRSPSGASSSSVLWLLLFFLHTLLNTRVIWVFLQFRAGMVTIQGSPDELPLSDVINTPPSDAKHTAYRTLHESYEWWLNVERNAVTSVIIAGVFSTLGQFYILYSFKKRKKKQKLWTDQRRTQEVHFSWTHVTRSF